MRISKDKAFDAWVSTFELQMANGVSPRLSEEAYAELLNYYDEAQQVDQGLEVLDLAIAQYPFCADFYLRKAALLLEKKAVGRAFETLDRAEHLGANGIEALILRVEAFSVNESYASAESYLETLINSKNSIERQADLLVAQALLFEYQHAFERMYLILRAVLDLVPTHPFALDKIGLAVEVLKCYPESIALHQSIVDEHPYNAQAWFNLGQGYLYTGNYERAVEAFEYAFIIDPLFEPAYREYIDLCLELRQYDRVLRCYEELAQFFVIEIDDWLKIGQCYLYKGDFHKADSLLREAIKQDPFNAELYFLVGEGLSAQEEWWGAIHFYTKAIELEDQQEEYYAARGEVHFHLNQAEKAEADFLKAIKLAPEAGNFWLQYTSFLMETGKQELALEVFSEAEDQSNCSELLYGRVACLLTLGRRQEAIYRLGEALNQDYDSYGVLYELIPDLEKDLEIATLISSYTY